VRALLWPLFARSTWAQPGTVVAGTIIWPLFARSARAKPGSVVSCTTGEGAGLATVRSIGVGSDRLCGGGNDR
jgi:hypothetical protein